jgi:hypothetical protein
MRSATGSAAEAINANYKPLTWENLVSEGGLEHANAGNLPGSGKSCRQDTRPLAPVNHLPQHGIRRPQSIISAPAGDRARMSRTQGNGRAPAGTAVAGWPGRCRC